MSIGNKNKPKKDSSKNKTLSIVLLTSAIWAFGISSLGYINQYTNIKTISFDFAKRTAVVYMTNRELEKGEIIKQNDIISSEVEARFITNGAVKDMKQLVGKQVTHKIYKNQQLTPSDVIDAKIIKDNLIAYTVPVNLSLLNDNNLKANDHVDIIVDFKEKLKKTRAGADGKVESYTTNKPSEIVAGKVLVSQILDGKGNDIVKPELQNPQDRQQPAYITILVKKDLINNLNDAKKRGNLTIVKYLNPEKEKAQENYKPSWLE